MDSKFLKPYNPKETESRIYKAWEESGFFNPDTCVEKGLVEEKAKSFTIMMPPPNVTGVLHMGHALGLTLQDIAIRYKRMRGFRTLWLPGTDHAAIATQARVEKDIYKKEGRSRYDLGREEFLKRVETFAKESHDTIVSQIKVMGASCDWSREAFTLDKTRSLAVRTMFKKMHDDGLIYRGFRVVNWDPKGQTTISDDEIVYEERKAKLYTFRYSKDFPIPVATTRPETKLGDVGVAVHPEGKWKKYIGETFKIDNFAGVKLSIKVVGDNEVDPEFGTGAVGLTPTHSNTDWEIAKRHNLDKTKVIINEFAKMINTGALTDGKKTTEARKIVVTWLKENKLLEKEEDTAQNVATAERTGGIVEPLPKLQWFIDVNKAIPERSGKTLKDIMREAVQSKKIKILPEYFDKTYSHWIDNLRDWCISRQIWYGHRIPVWYCTVCNKNKMVGSPEFEREFDIKNSSPKQPIKYIDSSATFIISIEKPSECPNCHSQTEKIVQDPDTLDTWFSSGLWTFSTLGWPEKTKDLELYHPTSLLIPAYEILFFWVARMILMSGYALDTIPFETVYLTGIVRDAKGRKFSKSLGNGIDPIDVAEKFGTDAGRLALVIGNTPGTDTKISEEKIRGYKNFANKIWNIARFVLSNTEDIKYDGKFETYSENDATLKKELDDLLTDVTADMDNFRFYLATEKLYHYAWHTFADKILEDSKTIFDSGKSEEIISRKQFLIQNLRKILIALHPFMPFVTEEIWQLIGNKNFLIVEKWPIEK